MTLQGEVKYICPKCGEANYIPLENFADCLNIYDVLIPYGNGEHTSAIEFYSPKCSKCGENTTSFIRK